jgi:hypothetical protein
MRWRHIYRSITGLPVWDGAGDCCSLPPLDLASELPPGIAEARPGRDGCASLSGEGPALPDAPKSIGRCRCMCRMTYGLLGKFSAQPVERD